MLKDKCCAPHLLPNVKPEMLSAGYWISQDDHPDELLLTRDLIVRQNELNIQKKLINDLESAIFDQKIQDELNQTAWDQMQAILADLKTKQLYNSDGSVFTKSLYQDIIHDFPSQIEAFDSLFIGKFAVFSTFSNEKMVPSSLSLTEKPFDSEFDYLQNNGHDAGTLTYAFCFSKNKKYIYQINGSSSGWVSTNNYFFPNNIQSLIRRSFITIDNAYADVWANPEQTQFLGKVRMGSRYILADQYHDTCFPVFFPGPNRMITVYIPKKDAIPGVKLLTTRSLLTDAFKWLNQPYGWGDTHQFVDCSKMIQLLFSIYGLKLPRNGGSQAQISENLLTDTSQKEKQIIETGRPGLTLLRFPGHIMLYIGQDNHKPYVLHALYFYKEKRNEEQYSRMTNRVVISDLSLGENTDKLSLLERISHAINTGNV